MKLGAWRKRLFITLAVIAAAILLPTSIILCVGMLPTAIMLLFDRTSDKSRAITVGAMNLAGCMPFILEVWQRGHTVEIALSYITQPRTIVVMYFAAGIGYMIEWVVTGLVASIMVQKAKARIGAIEKRQQQLEARWGQEVNGKQALDDEGFPIDNAAH